MINKKTINYILFIIGFLLCGFTVLFLITGMDEIWNGFNLWWYGIGIAGMLSSVGMLSIIISFNKQPSRFLFYLLVLSIILIIVGIFQF
ncbi:hypothetical protein KAI52_03175 [Candidatus Parcubacteria bacterium]|nr:hypothetical protein [Candidatus Parcubacteria bacterium]